LIFLARDDGQHPIEETQMKSFFLAFVILGIAIQPSSSQAPQTNQAPQTAGKRINKAIDLLSRGQPIYYTGEGGGNSTESAFGRGKRLGANHRGLH
jgi:hypothetical protein